MRLAERPKSMIIIGGGYIAAEFAHVFAAFGTAVTVLNRSDVLLRREDADIAKRFTDLLGQSSRCAGQHQRARRSKAPPVWRVRVHTEGPEGQPESIGMRRSCSLPPDGRPTATPSTWPRWCRGRR